MVETGRPFRKLSFPQPVIATVIAEISKCRLTGAEVNGR